LFITFIGSANHTPIVQAIRLVADGDLKLKSSLNSGKTSSGAVQGSGNLVDRSGNDGGHDSTYGVGNARLAVLRRAVRGRTKKSEEKGYSALKRWGRGGEGKVGGYGWSGVYGFLFSLDFDS
jgi:hypothetical protein